MPRAKKADTRSNRWRKPIHLTVNGGCGEAWAYVSKSGKTVEVYISAIGDLGKRSSPLSAKISILRVNRWAGNREGRK